MMNRRGHLDWDPAYKPQLLGAVKDEKGIYGESSTGGNQGPTYKLWKTSMKLHQYSTPLQCVVSPRVIRMMNR
jgi:hypothetical protein